jgi:hypothetical protein
MARLIETINDEKYHSKNLRLRKKRKILFQQEVLPEINLK